MPDTQGNGRRGAWSHGVGIHIEDYLVKNGLLGRKVAIIPDQLYRKAVEESQELADMFGSTPSSEPEYVWFCGMTRLVGVSEAGRQLHEYYKMRDSLRSSLKAIQ